MVYIPLRLCSNISGIWGVIPRLFTVTLRKPSLQLFSERELTFTFAMLSPVRQSVCLSLSVTLVRRTQAIEIFGNISTAFGTLAIR